MQQRVVFFFLTIVLLIMGTTVVILYGKGYRLSFEPNKTVIAGTGLLVATSDPDGGQIFINGRLNSATNDTLNLLPGDYEVEIVKVGYLPWKKRLKVEKEVVTKTDARLFPVAPKLESLTSTGVVNPVVDPTTTRIAYKITDLTAEKNGIYIFEMSSRPILTLQSNANKLADDRLNPFSKADISFSPNAKFLVATLSATTYVMSLENSSEGPQLTSAADFTEFQAQWKKERDEKEASRKNAFKSDVRSAISSNFNIISWSPDEAKILYQASQSATLPLFITPPLAGSNSQPQTREIKKGKVYVYDTREDKNFLINETFSKLSWLDSRHLVLTQDGKIQIIEHDGINKTTVYAGPFVEDFVAAWPDGSKIVILTNLGNPNVSPNLYTVSLK